MLYVVGFSTLIRHILYCPPQAMQPTVHTFPSGGLTLSRVCLACPDPVARVVLVHGYGDHSGRYHEFYRYLADHRIEAHGIDLRGHGRSSGRRGCVTSWDDHLTDLRAAIDLPELCGCGAGNGPLPTFVLGHSHGGLIVAVAAARGLLGDAGVRGIVLCSPYFRNLVPVPRWKLLLAHAADRIVPWLRVSSGLNDDWMTGDPAMVADSRADGLLNRGATPRWFIRTRAVQATVLGLAPRVTLPVLCLTGGADQIADPSVAQAFVDTCGSVDKSYRCYPGQRHELLREVERQTTFSDVVQFVQSRA